MATENELNELVTEVFNITGQKVTLDDPILAVALIQSAFARKVGSDLSGELRSAANDLQKAANSDRQLLAELSASAQQTLQSIHASGNAFDNEMLKAHLTDVTKEVMKSVRKDAIATIPMALTAKSVAAAATLSLFIGACGMVLGIAWERGIIPIRADKLTKEEKNQIQAGKAILRVLPSLDRETREKLVRQLDQK